MLRRKLNLGIVAHVDAGKTTLTERLLYTAGILDEPGSVDKGTTQTDSLELEQQRGITIKSAVVSFELDDVTVNLIDTPGHPDFIAEVERVVGVLDGAVLVVSAVEGVQPQTRILMRVLDRLRIPALIFVNKVDRMGAGSQRVFDDISERLTKATIAMTSVSGEGTRAARVASLPVDDPGFRSRTIEVLTERDERLLAAYVEDEADVSWSEIQAALVDQTGHGLVRPVYFGSAITGSGIDELVRGLVELLPAKTGNPDDRLSGTVFKIDRGSSGERIAYVRLFSGTLRTRERVRFGRECEEKVTAIRVFDRGLVVQRKAVAAGEIATLTGLAEIQIGDTLGERQGGEQPHGIPPPTLESVVTPCNRADGQRLRLALAQLAEQDPLINVRQDDGRHELSVSLYGQVQKEVIQATLAADFNLDVTFHETTPIYVERPVGTGEAVEVLHAESNPFLATIGLRVEPAPAGSGVAFGLDVDARSVPLYIYKTLDSFREHMDHYVHDSLQEGLFGWEVTDCTVTMTVCMYSVPDGPPSRRGPLSTAADFRKLTPIVLVEALERAGTVVCEPTVQVTLEVPTVKLASVIPALGRLGAGIAPPSPSGRFSTIESVMPTSRADELQRQLPRLTGGEGVLDSSFAGYEPVPGEQPVRRRER